MQGGDLLQNLGDTLTELSKNLLFSLTQWSSRIFATTHIEGNYWIILDILVTAFIIYWFLSKIMESKAVRVLYGIIIIILLLIVGHLLNLATLNWLLKYLGVILVVAIPIIFQPEIRAALDKLGRAGFANNHKFTRQTLSEILTAVQTIQQRHLGAVIALERKIPLSEYNKSGHTLNADVSQELILSIFTPPSPLHDGAVLISGNKLIAAGCVLPVSEEKEQWGARHRAARTLSRHTDALVIVISEERGVISVAFESELESSLTMTDIKQIIEKLFHLN